MHSTNPWRLIPKGAIAIVLGVLGLLALALSACEEDAPTRFVTNDRHGDFLITNQIPSGQVTVASSDLISVAIDKLPVLAAGQGFAYEGWLTFVDADTNRADASTGRFSIVPTGGPDLIHRTGSVRFTYASSGAFQVTAGGDELAQGEALPSGIDFSDSLSFFLAIEPHPDNSPNPGFTHLLVGAEDLQNPPGPVKLIVPVNLGSASAGDFLDLDAEGSLSATTGGFHLRFQQMPVLNRTTPPDDPGLIYQAWFVDLDQSPPRYQNITRFVPNQIGDRILEGNVHPGDLDGDGAPEPLDFEWIVVSLEPDGLNAQQPIGQGLDTSGEIFPVVPYYVRLPLAHQ